METIYLVLIATFAGVGLRTIYAFLMKYASGELPAFDKRYIAYALSTMILVLMMSISFALNYQVLDDAVSQGSLFLIVFLGAFVTNDVLNDSVGLIRRNAPAPSE